MEFSQDTTQIDVKYIASLARIALSAEEIEALQPQMKEILAFFGELKQLDVSQAELADIPDDVVGWRSDEPGEELGQQVALDLAVQGRHEQFVVPKIIE